MLDGQVGDAATRVDAPLVVQRPGRADVTAVVAGRAAARPPPLSRRLRGQGRQRRRRQHLADHEPAPQRAMDQQRVLALKAQAGAGGVVGFQQRRGVRPPQEPLARQRLLQRPDQSAQLAAQHAMVVPSPRIHADAAGRRGLPAGRRCRRCVLNRGKSLGVRRAGRPPVVPEAHHDHGRAVFQQRRGIGLCRSMALQIAHLPVPLARDPAVIAALGDLGAAGRGDSQQVQPNPLGGSSDQVQVAHDDAVAGATGSSDSRRRS